MKLTKKERNQLEQELNIIDGITNQVVYTSDYKKKLELATDIWRSLERIKQFTSINQW